MACGDVLSLEDLQTAKKHQIFEAEVITGKAGGVAGGASIGTATNPVTGQTQQTLPSILADLGFDVQSWTSSTGGVLASANQVFLNDTPGSLGLGDYYAWGGTFPKTVPAGTDPAMSTSGYIMRSSRFAGTQAREALRRSYAESGYNLVAGSFEAGGALVNANDVLLQERTGKAFTGPAGTVAAGTNPASGGFVDKSSITSGRGFLYPESYGVVYGVESTAAMQACLNDSIAQQKRILLRGDVIVTSLAVPDDWVSIQIHSDYAGVAYAGAEGRKITFTGGGLLVPLHSNNHNRVDIRGVTFVRSGSTRQSTAIDFQVDGTRPFNYPIMWVFEDINFRKFSSMFGFTRTGGSIDPDGFIGTTDIKRLNGYDCDRFMLVDGCYLNLFSIDVARFHGMAEGVRIKNGGGGFFDFYNAHWEGVNDDNNVNNGLIVLEGFSLETRFTFHNHDWERCGQMVRLLGTHTRKTKIVFTGKNRFNSFLIPDQEFVDVELTNYSGDQMYIIPVRTIINTPETVRVKSRDSVVFDSSRVCTFYVPTRAYRASGVNKVSDMMAGVRQFGAASVAAGKPTNFNWIRALGATYYSSNQAATKNSRISGSDMFVLSGVADFVQGATRLGSPIAITLDNGSPTSINYTDPAFTGTTGTYAYGVLIKCGVGVNLTSLAAAMVSDGGNRSIGFGKFVFDSVQSVLSLLPAEGNKLSTHRSVGPSATTNIPLRDGSDTKFCVDVKASTDDGAVYLNSVSRGVSTNSSTKTISSIVSSVGTSWTATINAGDNPDFCRVTATNNSAATTEIEVYVEII